MPAPASPQLRFLLRGSLLFVAFLALWWLVLLHPLLDGVRLSTDMVLYGGGVTVASNGDWIVKVPIPQALANGDSIQHAFGRTPGGPLVPVRSLRLAIAPRIPTFFTLSFPLFWALALTAPWPPRLWRILAIGSAILWLLAVLSLLLYTVYSLQSNLKLSAPGLARNLWNAAEYLNVNVAPYMAPVLLALGLHRDLRKQILGWEMPVAPLKPKAAAPEKPRRGRFRG